MSFFPQLVAGPIERSPRLLPQFLLNTNLIMIGKAWSTANDMGFFKKVVIADRLAIVVDGVYNNLDDYSGLALIVATIFFTFQIYCDFSGYSDIAIGSARVMGFELMDNFRGPISQNQSLNFGRDGIFLFQHGLERLSVYPSWRQQGCKIGAGIIISLLLS